MATKRLSLRIPFYVAGVEVFLCAVVLFARVFYIYATAAMWPYIVTFIAVAVFPLALAGYGGHLATLAIPEQSKGRWKPLVIVWSLAIIGVVLFGVSQIMAYRADRTRDHDDNGFRTKVLVGLQQIIDEPDTTSKKQDASALKTILTASTVGKPAKDVTPSSPITVINVPPASSGNLKVRALSLADDIQMYATYRFNFCEPIIEGKGAKSLEDRRIRIESCADSTTRMYRQDYEQQVISIASEFADLHLRNQRLDENIETIKRDEQEEQFIGRPIPIETSEMRDISERLRLLANSIN